MTLTFVMRFLISETCVEYLSGFMYEYIFLIFVSHFLWICSAVGQFVKRKAVCFQAH